MRPRSFLAFAHRLGGRAVPILLVGALAGCKKPAAVESESGAVEGPSHGASATDPQRVLARVGAHTITLGDYAAALEHMDEFDRMRYEAPERRKELLDEMIDVLLLADEAKERGYDQEPEAQQQLREILRDAILKKAREGAPSADAIPAEQVRAYYEAHRSDFHDPERRRISAIVVQNKATAQRVLEAARTADAGAWGDLARTYSVERPAGEAPADLAGDMGFVSPPGDPRGNNPHVPAGVRSAVFEASHVGDVVPRVVDAAGLFYVVKLESKSDPRDRTLEDAERSIRVKLAHDAARAREDALLEQLRKEIPVEVDEAALADVKVDVAQTGLTPSGPRP
ncbi:MAG TPA: peptidyl-prolyl cis-trans isomerase [Polyangiaceae bacterium]|nr:peptidyl-prolyl cis-trans isomerase [Polyangiaceae bacterium]